MRTTLVVAQALTFVGLGALLVISHEWRLGAAQLLLAVITGLVYL